MILVTGGSGLFGRAVRDQLEDTRLLSPTRAELDYSRLDDVVSYIRDNKVDTVIHLAAKVGGVKANMENQFSFYHHNSAMNNNILEACISQKVKKLVCCLSTCIYPDQEYINYPLTEDQLHLGPPHSSNFGYAYSKRMVDVQIRAAREQYGVDYISVIPNNLYGEGDNFDLESSHVIPALIRKIWEAKINNRPSFEVWGDGLVYREFTYAPDAAKALLHCLQNYSEPEPINIGNTQQFLLRDVINIVKDILEYDGEIIFDTSKPKGQERKPSSNRKLIEIGWDASNYTSLQKGLKNTCEWFKINYPYNIRGLH